jgi:hypothetical protein
MRRGTELAILNDFSGGENYLYPSLSMPPKYSAIMQNCHISPRGGIAKVPGFVKVNDVAVPEVLRSGFEFRKSDGTIKILVAGGGTIYTANDDGTMTDIKSGLDADAIVYFAQFNDLTIIMNGVDDPMKYDGAVVTDLAGQKPGTILKKPHVHKGRIWAVDSVDKMTAFHSALNAAEDWTTADNAGYIDFRYVLPQGDELLEIKSFVDLIVFIFKNHVAIYSGTDPTSGGDFILTQIINGNGVVAPNCAYSLGMDLFFLQKEGLRSLRQAVTVGNMNIANISKPITPAIQAEISLNINNIYSICQYRKNAWLMMLVNSRIFVYSYEWKAWGHIAIPEPIDGEEDRRVFGMFGTADGSVYLCGNGYIYEYGSGHSFAGNNMPVWWETGWLNLGRSPFNDYPRLAEVVCFPGVIMDVSLDLAFDFAATMQENFNTITTLAAPSITDQAVPDIWDNSFYMDVSNYPPIRIPLFGEGKTVKLICSINNTLGPFEINKLTIQGRRGGSL